MNTVTNKAIVIAVGIFITVAITSAIMVTITLMRDVYSDVYETDITISSGFGEFDEYDGTTKTGLDLLNTVNEYYGRQNIELQIKRSSGTVRGSIDLSDTSYIDNYILPYNYYNIRKRVIFW